MFVEPECLLPYPKESLHDEDEREYRRGVTEFYDAVEVRIDYIIARDQGVDEEAKRARR